MTDELFCVDGQVVIASGASRGIGRAIATGFAERGATVIITGRRQETIEQTAADLSASGANVVPRVCDVSRPDDIDRLVESVIGEFDRIDTLLNIAGVNQRKPAESFTPDEYDSIVNTNLRGAFFLSQAVGRCMIERRSGCQINIDSLNTYAPLKGVMPYAMSKSGMKAMTRGLAMEWGPYGVRVNGLAPGFILTDLTSKLWSQPHMQKWNEANTPMQRLGVPEDMVGTAIFLASPASAFLTGQTIYVDGGMVAGIQWPIDFEQQ